jgi:hypothetical protein
LLRRIQGDALSDADCSAHTPPLVSVRTAGGAAILRPRRRGPESEASSNSPPATGARAFGRWHADGTSAMLRPTRMAASLALPERVALRGAGSRRRPRSTDRSNSAHFEPTLHAAHELGRRTGRIGQTGRADPILGMPPGLANIRHDGVGIDRPFVHLRGIGHEAPLVMLGPLAQVDAANPQRFGRTKQLHQQLHAGRVGIQLAVERGEPALQVRPRPQCVSDRRDAVAGIQD